MEFIQFSSELKTGIEVLDEQHQGLIREFNLFIARNNFQSSSPYIEDCLDFLKHYVMKHFKYEEAMQVESSYPRYLSHQATHDRLTIQVKSFLVKMENGVTSELLLEFKAFFENWLRNHVYHEDSDFVLHYKEYLKSCSVQNNISK